MTNPAERAALDRLNQLAGAGGQHERTQGDFRSTVSQYLSETVPVLTHPRVATSLLDLTGDINMFDIAHITASPLLSKIDELLTTRSKPVRRLNPLWGIDDKKSENFRLGFCLYKCTDEVQTYQIGVKVEAERVKHRSNTQNDPVQYDLNTILTTFFPAKEMITLLHLLKLYGLILKTL